MHVMLLAVPDGAFALGAGAVLAVGAAAVVLGPLWRGGPAFEPDPAPRTVGPPRPGVGDRATAVDALREIEFDRATGKLSDADYAALKAAYTRQALAELRAADARDAAGDGAVVAVADDVEAAIRSFRGKSASCSACGPRPEPDAVFCSACGRFLPGRCPACGGACDAEAQRYCGGCGHALAA
jgi:hypothetical protein